MRNIMSLVSAIALSFAVAVNASEPERTDCVADYDLPVSAQSTDEAHDNHSRCSTGPQLDAAGTDATDAYYLLRSVTHLNCGWTDNYWVVPGWNCLLCPRCGWSFRVFIGW